MRYLAALLAMVLTAPAFGGEKPANLPIQVSWHGQSFFTVKSTRGTIVAFDPHAIPEYGRTAGLRADIILISHNHNDHNQVGVFENIKDKGLRILAGLKGPGIKAEWSPIDETIKDIRIRSVASYHDNLEGMRFGKNTIFVVDIDGWKIAHLGDLGHPLSQAQVKKMGHVDVLMIPVGGVYTLNGSEAKEVVAQIKPKEYIFPMHCGTRVYEDLLPVTEFLEDQDRAKVTSSLDNRLILNRDPQRPRPLIVQLNYWPKTKRD